MNSPIMIVSSWDNKIPSEQVFNLQKTLESVDDSALSALSMIQLKDPIIGLLLGLFFGVFGVDRFYKGDIGLGIAICVLTLTLFGLVISAIWVIADLFLVYSGIKKDNLQKITQVLALAKKK